MLKCRYSNKTSRESAMWYPFLIIMQARKRFVRNFPGN